MVSRCEREARTVTGFRDQNGWTRPEYESVRAASTSFAVALDNENPEPEIVIGECARDAVVTTVDRFAIRISRETDPRSFSGGRA